MLKLRVAKSNAAAVAAVARRRVLRKIRGRHRAVPCTESLESRQLLRGGAVAETVVASLVTDRGGSHHLPVVPAQLADARRADGDHHIVDRHGNNHHAVHKRRGHRHHAGKRGTSAPAPQNPAPTNPVSGTSSPGATPPASQPPAPTGPVSQTPTGDTQAKALLQQVQTAVDERSGSPSQSSRASGRPLGGEQ